MQPESGFLMLSTGVVTLASTSERSKARSVPTMAQLMSLSPRQ